MLLRALGLILALIVPASAATRLNVAIGADVNVVEVHKTLLGPGSARSSPTSS
jgi:antitoxin component of MazEF toxin-antitoxin module